MARSTARPVQAPKPRGKQQSSPWLRGRNLWLVIGGAAVVAVVIAVVLVVVNLTGGSSEPKAAAVQGGAATGALFKGLPQQGIFVGSPDAPVTLVEYADLQCPYCARWAEQSLPTIVQRYVRAGKLRLEFRGMAFVGEDSIKALQIVIAAGNQGKLWNVLDLFYRNQGTENTGWVTDSLVRGVLDAVPGLDADRVLAERTSNGVADQMLASQQRASSAGINSTPSFQLTRKGGAPQRIEISSLDPSGITPAIDRALAG